MNTKSQSEARAPCNIKKYCTALCSLVSDWFSLIYIFGHDIWWWNFFSTLFFKMTKELLFDKQIMLYCNFSASFKDEISFWVHFGGKSNLENFSFESFFWFVIQLWFFVFHLWSKDDLKLFGKWKFFFMFSKLFYLQIFFYFEQF